jgi:N-dimethylarginine dimethylaminohydrolase
MHLDTAMAIIDSRNIICCEKVLSAPDSKWLEDLDFQLHRMPEEEARNMVCNTLSLREKRILSCSQNNHGNVLLAKLGFQVLEANISQFVRDSGGVHCLINPILRDSSAHSAISIEKIP